MRCVLVMVAMAACAPATATTVVQAPQSYRRASVGDRKLPAPDELLPMPWRIGQSLRYELRGTNGVVSEYLAVIANDACGFWFERSVYEGGRLCSWLFCVRATAGWDPRYSVEFVIERRGREVIAVHDLRLRQMNRAAFNWLLALVEAPWTGRADAPRADVATPAGEFAGAVKLSDDRVTRWSHPAIPLAGVVREVHADHERVLVGFATSSRTTGLVDVARDLELAQRSFRAVNARPSPWFRLDAGFGSLGRPSDTDLTIGKGVATGGPVAQRFDVTAMAMATGAAAHADDATLTEELIMLTAGVRWFPWGRTRIERSGILRHALFYTQAELGYADLERWPDGGERSTVGRGVVFGARLGLVTTSERGWTMGCELRDHVALLNSDEGLRHTFGVHIYVQLFMRPLRYTLPW